MSEVGILSEANPTSNHVANVIAVLDPDEPGAYRVEWKGERENPDKSYDVETVQTANRPQLHLEGNRTIDANPLGKPQVVYHNPSDGYPREQRLVDLKLFASKYHWRHRVRYISEDLKRQLNLHNPF